MMTYTENKSKEKTKNNNTVDPYRLTQGIKAKFLDAYGWKQYLSDIVFSPEVLLVIMSGKAKLKLNRLLKFSSWSAN